LQSYDRRSVDDSRFSFRKRRVCAADAEDAVARRCLKCRRQRRGLMNKLELVEHIAKETELSKASAASALEALLDGIGKSLKKGDEVRLVGFGTFSVRERAAGKGRNPSTGKEIKIPASKNARFKAGAALKASLNTKKAAKKS
jgi:DNA-binding protein HU-beta